MIGYYDLVLGLIPLTLLGISGGLYGVGLNLTTAVPLGAVVATVLVGHAMFVNAPIDTNGRRGPDSTSTRASNAARAPGAD